jgi:hypothetical protein
MHDRPTRLSPIFALVLELMAKVDHDKDATKETRAFRRRLPVPANDR